MTSNSGTPWTQPESAHPQTGLVINNSITKSKVPFVPIDGNKVSWYACGPTVYDASHMGHACNYVTFDIIRRIMEDYFNYDLNVVMNITDVDDKIILRARQKYLLQQYQDQVASLSEQTISDVEAALYEFAKKKLGAEINNRDGWKAFAASAGDGKGLEFTKGNPEMTTNFVAAQTAFAALEAARDNVASGETDKANAALLISAAEDVLAVWLDKQFGATVTEHRIFRDLAAYWEKDYFEDMDALNVRRPHVLTRVSEFVPEIVDFIQRIIDNGYAYEAGGHVMFDVSRFDGKNGHFYAKLEPGAKGNTGRVEEGEGALRAYVSAKRSSSDFALWKESKPGEPKWPSPWGYGRPGWHIECSVMASEILGSRIDMHTGGIDLAFPHHDNEMAQSEACFENHQWINYFLHTGHLHIEGSKMSKSLKNFIPIKQALKQYTARQIRILFLLSQWDSNLFFDSNSMQGAIAVERTFTNFFTNTSALLREFRLRWEESDGNRKFKGPELELFGALNDTKARVHSALLDSFDTPTAMRALQEIVASTNIYLQRGRANIDPQIVEAVGLYVTKIARVFGLVSDGVGSSIGWGSGSAIGVNGTEPVDRESILLPVATVLSNFRDAVRDIALAGGDKKTLLSLCDRIRDNDLPDLGIIIDDQGDGRALVKFADPEALQRERGQREAEEEARRLKKEAQARENEAKRQMRLEKARVPPKEMFRTPEMSELYSAWDENGLPTKDKAGEDLTKTKLKKLAKDQAAQEKLHNEYLKSLE
ncbi:cysteinyl-tRNA synthetase [Coemansia spiralis]|uniref:cysteine--tRNA ligase n=2 Tax=Coemansia TaxID=4863 RepID=A0A9W8KY40_9FUNG|nr:cysteinyl-tRNA synthetase [Coemansia umbellata]KAJ2625356.1 cysteinyl-tRNA synthetase [Coemansia sp. RSA 1358]KAJ2676174.1 cysteinyl-tRNA synthetase [Coemansia spiralis]